MAYTDINTEDRLVQVTFSENLEKDLGREDVYALNDKTLGTNGTLGHKYTREAVLKIDLRRVTQWLVAERAVKSNTTRNRLLTRARDLLLSRLTNWELVV